MKIHGWIFILVGVFVVVVSVLVDTLDPFKYLGGLFIIYGLAKLGIDRMKKVLTPPEDDGPVNLNVVENPYLRQIQQQQPIQQGQQSNQQGYTGQQHAQQSNQQHLRQPVHHAQPHTQQHVPPHLQQAHHHGQQQQGMHPGQHSDVHHHAQQVTTMFCHMCGAKNVTHANFCSGCGTRMR